MGPSEQHCVDFWSLCDQWSLNWHLKHKNSLVIFQYSQILQYWTAHNRTRIFERQLQSHAHGIAYVTGNDKVNNTTKTTAKSIFLTGNYKKLRLSASVAIASCCSDDDDNHDARDCSDDAWGIKRENVLKIWTMLGWKQELSVSGLLDNLQWPQ